MVYALQPRRPKGNIDLLLELFQLRRIESLVPADIYQDLDSSIELQQRLRGR